MPRPRGGLAWCFLLVVLAACSSPESPPDGAAPSPGRTAASSCLGAAPVAAPGERPGNFNALAASRAELGAPPRTVAPSGAASVDGRLGVPTFLWATQERAALQAVAPGRTIRTPADAARAHLRGRSGDYGLAASDVDAAVVTHVHDTGEGAVVVKLRQPVGGIEVFREEAAVAMDRAWNLVAISGNLSPAAAPASLASGAAFALGEADAIAAALADLTGEAFSASEVVLGAARGAYRTAALAAGVGAARAERLTRPARAKKVWFRLPGALEPAYYVEVGVQRPEDPEPLDYGYVVSAADGRVLFRNDHLAHDAYSFRVWAEPEGLRAPYDGPHGYAATPHPTGLPDGYQAPFVPQQLVTLQNVPFSRNDPWLPAGATSLAGNNAEAYADLGGGDGYQAGADVPGIPSAPGAFDYEYRFDVGPLAAMSQVQAALAQLFYDVNWLHDVYYDLGFDEAAGNAQADNLGRGGEGGDSMRAEAQDSSGVNNANMMTPSDGDRPRMQMYLFSGNGSQALRVNSPDLGIDIAGVAAAFGAQGFELTGDLVYAEDADPTGTTAEIDGTKDACEPLTNAAAVAGKIVLAHRGKCGFAVKAAVAQAAGAAGVVIANVAASQTLGNMGGADATVTIPALLVGKPFGDAIRAAMETDTVNVTMIRQSMLQRDGTIDNTIVAHEWGHYISNRLVHDANGLDNNQGRSMGEGWSDVHALLMAVRPEDADVASNAAYGGVYGLAAFVSGGYEWYGPPNQGFYFGIRRLPYSTDFTKNGLTFKHIANGNPIGEAAPILFDWDGTNNAEYHNAGEIWATALWECTVALLNDERYAFEEAREQMMRYLVAAYKLTPASPTMLEARDAFLAAAKASDEGDWKLFARAFAKRGMGAGAVGPDRWSVEHTPVIESYVAGKVLAIVDVAYAGTASGCEDGDAVLDDGEEGVLTLRVRSIGTEAIGAGAGTLSSPNAHLSFPAGAAVAIPALQPGEEFTAAVGVALQGASGFERIPLSLGSDEVDAPAVYTLVGDLDEEPNATTTETFEAPTLRWTPEHDAALSDGTFAWRRFTEAPDAHHLHAPDLGHGSDLRIVSPPLVVSGRLTVGFRHKHDFEADAPTTANRAYYDGGVLELSEDGGTTWVDVGGEYDGRTLLAYAGNPNPLAGRKAFVARNAAWPAWNQVHLDLGDAYAGKTVRLRFRVGTDVASAGEGWHVDDVHVGGVVPAPFSSVVADRRICQNRPPVADAGAPITKAEGTEVTLDASGSSDPDAGTTLTYAWVQVSGTPVALTGANGASPTFTAPAVGHAGAELVFEVTVSDGALSDTALATVLVANVNGQPVAEAGLTQVAPELVTVVLDGTGSSDPDGDALSYSWSQVSGPAVVLTAAQTARPSFIAPSVTQLTELEFELAVSDGSAVSSDRVKVNVVDAVKKPKDSGCATSPGAANPSTLLLLAGAALLALRRRRPA